MSQDIPGLVETSTNLASVKMKPGNIIRIETSQRSSTESSKQDIATMVRTVFEMAGANVSFGDGYPGLEAPILTRKFWKWQRRHTNACSV